MSGTGKTRAPVSGALGWCLPGSNWGHTDFQSVALPAELRHLVPPQVPRYGKVLYCEGAQR